jgi:hypothetical protein
VTRPVNYTYRVSGWVTTPISYELKSTQVLGGIAPTLAQPETQWTSNQEQEVDFIGKFTLQLTMR